MPSSITFRQATADDALCLSVLATQVFLDTYATNGINADLAKEALSVYSVGVLRARLDRADVEILVAEQGANLVAFLDLDSSTRCPVSEVCGLEVFRLYVQAPFVGRGLGRELMEAAERRAQEQAKPFVWLTAWSGNHNALGFYGHLNYRDAGSTAYVIEGRSYENRVMAKRVTGGA